MFAENVCNVSISLNLKPKFSKRRDCVYLFLPLSILHCEGDQAPPFKAAHYYCWGGEEDKTQLLAVPLQ